MDKFAPEYTKRERVILTIKYLSVGLPVMSFFQYWFFPNMETFGKVAHCYDFGVFNGVELIFYGVFVGIPLSLALMLFAFGGRRCLLILKLKQTPPPGYKVFKPTAYKYGNKALIQPIALLLCCFGLVLFSIYGIGSAQDIINSPKSMSLINNKLSLPECQTDLNHCPQCGFKL